MEHTSSKQERASKRTDRPMIGLRMDPEEAAQCKALAAQESRSAASFALLMYRIGIAQFKGKKGPQK